MSFFSLFFPGANSTNPVKVNNNDSDQVTKLKVETKHNNIKKIIEFSSRSVTLKCVVLINSSQAGPRPWTSTVLPTGLENALIVNKAYSLESRPVYGEVALVLLVGNCM